MRFKIILTALIIVAAITIPAVIIKTTATQEAQTEAQITTTEVQEIVNPYETLEVRDMSVQYPSHWSAEQNDDSVVYKESVSIFDETTVERDISGFRQGTYTNAFLCFIDDPDFIITARERVDEVNAHIEANRENAVTHAEAEVITINGIEAAQIKSVSSSALDFLITEIYIPYNGIQYYAGFNYDITNDSDIEIMSAMIDSLTINTEH